MHVHKNIEQKYKIGSGLYSTRKSLISGLFGSSDSFKISFSDYSKIDVSWTAWKYLKFFIRMWVTDGPFSLILFETSVSSIWITHKNCKLKTNEANIEWINIDQRNKMISKKNSVSVSSSPKVKQSTSSWPLPSLRLVIVCVSLAVTLTMSAMIIFVDVRAPSLADIFLSIIYFPLGQGLQLKVRRWSNNKTECLHFLRSKDENFRRFDGVQCGHAFWQSTANIEEKDRYVKKIVTHYKLFERESLASKYFHEYWHDKLRDPLPTNFYFEETENAPKAGNEFRAFRWDPLAPPPPEISSNGEGQNLWIHRAAATSRHIIFIFRWGK